MKISLGIEFGSTRIKAILINEKFQVMSQGIYNWENKFEDGYWTYSLDEIEKGLKSCVNNLRKNYKNRFKKDLDEVSSIGISGMMHGYLAFDKDDKLLVPFRTWRNTTTEKSSSILSKIFNFNIPQRYSISHLYQAILNKEKHVNKISYITTLAGYIHYKLTGQKIVGIGEASGMFPIDNKLLSYDKTMIKKFNNLIKGRVKWRIEDILPVIKLAGQNGGLLNNYGRKLFKFKNKKIILCPPEGDAQTGMVATNSIKNNTGNVSAGTSDFAMIVTDKKLNPHKEIDIVTTPVGKQVAMVHCNNCTSDINAWVNLFKEVISLTGKKINDDELFTKLFNISLFANKDAGGLTSFNYFSGEGVTDLNNGKPLLIRENNCNFNLANFMRMNIMSSLATLKIGLDILTKSEKVIIKKIYAHGGLFKTPKVGQTILSAAINAPVNVFKSASEGGAYGMSLLALYSLFDTKKIKLEKYLDEYVFKNSKITTIMADEGDIKGFNIFVKRYLKYLKLEKEAIK